MQTGRHADRQAGRLADRQTDKHAHKHIYFSFVKINSLLIVLTIIFIYPDIDILQLEISVTYQTHLMSRRGERSIWLNVMHQ